MMMMEFYKKDSVATRTAVCPSCHCSMTSYGIITSNDALRNIVIAPVADVVS